MKQRENMMKIVFATMAVAALAAWAAPVSAGVLFSDDGDILSQANPFIEFGGGPSPSGGSNTGALSIDLTGQFGVKLTFDTDGTGTEECGTALGDCLTVSINGTPIPGLDGISVPRPKDSFGPILLGVLGDDQLITLRFDSAFSAKRESFDISNIKLQNNTISEPAPIALFGLGLAGLGYMRRRRPA